MVFTVIRICKDIVTYKFYSKTIKYRVRIYTRDVVDQVINSVLT